MASLLEQLPYGQWSAVRLGREVELRAMVSAAGRSIEHGSGYCWNGRERGRRPFAVLQVTLAGSGVLERDGVSHPIHHGSAMLAFVPDSHRYRVDPKVGSWEFVYAVFHGEEVLRLLRELADPTHPVIAWTHGSPADTALYELVEAFLKPRRVSPYELSARAYNLAMSLHERVPEQQGSRIDRCREYIERHLAGRLTIETLARVAGLSRHHFSREFSRTTGLSPVRYLREARCERAAVLLTTTTLSVKEIADRCGFETANYFCRVYRASTGMSPTEYRRSRP